MMKFILARMICVAILWLSVTAVFAQPYRQLTAEDFQGVPKLGGGVVAYTNCSIEFGYQAQRQSNYYMLNFTIKLTMNHNDSWMDKTKIIGPEMLTEILKHEQGHYNIAYLEQQELLKAVSQTVFYANYQAVAKSIFDRIDAKYKQLNLSYDEGTQHMVNREQQHNWDVYFKHRLGGEYLAQN